MSNPKSQCKMIICFVVLIIIMSASGANSASLPPDPDNAALLYYQALLCMPEYDTIILDPVLDGGEPDSAVRDYLRDCRQTIELALTAAEMLHCNWGILYSKGFPYTSPVLGKLRQLVFILVVDARTFAFDGDYQTAFERCLAVRKIGQHVNDGQIVSYLLSSGIDGMVQNCIQDLLGSFQPDADILEWLGGRLASFSNEFQSLTRALEMDFELVVQSVRKSEDTLALIRQQLADNVGDQNTKDEILNLTDDELIAMARGPYDEFLNAVFKTIDGVLPYADKYEEIQRLIDELVDEYGDDPATGYIVLCTGAKAGLILDFDIQIRRTAGYNALKAAIEVYHDYVATGQLPDVLPDNLPKDPFSGEDFEYLVTDQGFILRCRQVEISSDELREYNFNVTQ
jgi:hypothetical protein